MGPSPIWMRSIWTLFLLPVGGTLAASYIKLAAIWGQEIWGKDRKHRGTIHFFFLWWTHVLSIPSLRQSEKCLVTQPSRPTAWEIDVYVKTSVFRNLCTYWLLPIFQIVNASMFHCPWGSGRSTVFPKECAFYLFIFSKDTYLKLSRAQFVCLLPAYISLVHCTF